MLPDSRSNEKARFSENSWLGVTILQWFKRFDATLGLFARSALYDYSEGLHSRREIAQPGLK
jgi:hypothetical protein